MSSYLRRESELFNWGALSAEFRHREPNPEILGLPCRSRLVRYSGQFVGFAEVLVGHPIPSQPAIAMMFCFMSRANHSPGGALSVWHPELHYHSTIIELLSSSFPIQFILQFVLSNYYTNIMELFKFYNICTFRGPESLYCPKCKLSRARLELGSFHDS